MSVGIEGLEGHFTKHVCQLDLQDLLDIDEAGQYLPAGLTCCDKEEAMLVQSKLDLIIAELKQIKEILCRHKVRRQASQAAACTSHDCTQGKCLKHEGPSDCNPLPLEAHILFFR